MPPETEIEWTCEVCDQPIADDAGYVTASYSAINAYRDAERAWEEEHPKTGRFRIVPLTDYVSYPSRVRWSVLHQGCDPNPDSTDYWIGVERIRTAADVLGWSAHLLEKKWLSITTWSDVLYGIKKQLDAKEDHRAV